MTKDPTTELFAISLQHPNGTQIIRDKFGIQSLKDFIVYIAENKQVTQEQAKALILDSPKLRRIAFAIA